MGLQSMGLRSMRDCCARISRAICIGAAKGFLNRACAMVSARVHKFSSPVKVQVQGGDRLEVSFQDNGGEFDDVRLTGPADFVFEGRVEI